MTMTEGTLGSPGCTKKLGLDFGSWEWRRRLAGRSASLSLELRKVKVRGGGFHSGSDLHAKGKLRVGRPRLPQAPNWSAPVGFEGLATVPQASSPPRTGGSAGSGNSSHPCPLAGLAWCQLERRCHGGVKRGPVGRRPVQPICRACCGPWLPDEGEIGHKQLADVLA